MGKRKRMGEEVWQRAGRKRKGWKWRKRKGWKRSCDKELGGRGTGRKRRCDKELEGRGRWSGEKELGGRKRKMRWRERAGRKRKMRWWERAGRKRKRSYDEWTAGRQEEEGRECTEGGGRRNILLANRTQLIPADFLFLLLSAGLSAVTIGKYELLQYSDKKSDPSLRIIEN